MAVTHVTGPSQARDVSEKEPPQPNVLDEVSKGTRGEESIPPRGRPLGYFDASFFKAGARHSHTLATATSISPCSSVSA